MLVVFLSDFEGNEGKCCQEDGDDPEADGDFHFMMDSIVAFTMSFEGDGAIGPCLLEVTI